MRTSLTLPDFHLLLHVGENISCVANGEVTDGLSANFGKYANFLCWITGLYLTPESYGAAG